MQAVKLIQHFGRKNQRNNSSILSREPVKIHKLVERAGNKVRALDERQQKV